MPLLEQHGDQGIDLVLAQMGKGRHLVAALFVALGQVNPWIENAFPDIFRRAGGLPLISFILEALLGHQADAVLLWAKNAGRSGGIQAVADAAVLLPVDL